MLLALTLLTSAAAIGAPEANVAPVLSTVAVEGDAPPAPPAAVKSAMKLRALASKALATPLPKDLSDKDIARAMVRRAVAATVALGDDSTIASKLSDACKEAIRSIDTQPRAAALLVDMATRSAARDLAFRPILEAPLPKGFPYPAAAGEIQLAEYPQYRLARSSMGGRSQNGAFFTLFRHIQSNEIAMTAPVEMTMDDEGAMDMAFLYGDPAIGEAGQDGRVAVEDIKPMTVLTIGVRSSSRGTAIEGAMADLEDWLQKNSGTWERAGNTRLMGYNSPMVPRNRQFSEVQIPLKRVASN